MIDFLTVEEAAAKWNVTPDQARRPCQEGKIPGAVKKNGMWLIPRHAQYPDKNDKRSLRFRGTKKRVFEASIRLFAERTFDAVTLKDITDASGLAQSAIYRHFKTKHEILDAIYDFFQHNYIADRPQIPELSAAIEGGSPQQILSSVVYEFSPEYREMLVDCTKIVIQRLSVDERASELFRTLMLQSGLDYAERVYAKAIEVGTLPHADPYVLSVFSNMCQQAILFSWLAHADPAMNEKLVQSTNTLGELIILGLIAKERSGGNMETDRTLGAESDAATGPNAPEG